MLFVQASIEDLPNELCGVASTIHVNFPWGSLLRAVVNGDREFLLSLGRLASPGCGLKIVLSIDPERDRTEIQRLEIPEISESLVERLLAMNYSKVGFTLLSYRRLDPKQLRSFESTWARRLSSDSGRSIWQLSFKLDEQSFT